MSSTDSSRRAEHGVTNHYVHRSVDDLNRVVLLLEFPAVDAARGFLDDPELREAMKDAGVKGPANIVLTERTEQRTY